MSQNGYKKEIDERAKQAQYFSTLEIPKHGFRFACKCYNQKRKFNTLCDFLGWVSN